MEEGSMGRLDCFRVAGIGLESYRTEIVPSDLPRHQRRIRLPTFIPRCPCSSLRVPRLGERGAPLVRQPIREQHDLDAAVAGTDGGHAREPFNVRIERNPSISSAISNFSCAPLRRTSS